MASSPNGSREGRNKTILVVDDEPLMLALVRNMLGRDGYEVLEASEGEEALRISSQHRRGIDLLLTDIVMPRMNGYELATRLKAERSGLKVLFMSGYTDSIISEVVGAPIDRDSLIRKPFTYETLSSAIASALAH